LTVRRILLAAVVVACLAGGWGAADASSPSGTLSGRLTDGGVTVTVALAAGPRGTPQVRVRFTPQKTGYHLYSVNLPPGGVNGLGVATTVTVRGSLRAVGNPTADVPLRTLRIEELDVNLPVYPDGPVTIALPVRRNGNGTADVVVSYALCSLSNCMPPVRDRVIALAPVSAS
jgi:hypothetical protein